MAKGRREGVSVEADGADGDLPFGAGRDRHVVIATETPDGTLPVERLVFDGGRRGGWLCRLTGHESVYDCDVLFLGGMSAEEEGGRQGGKRDKEERRREGKKKEVKVSTVAAFGKVRRGSGGVQGAWSLNDK